LDKDTDFHLHYYSKTVYLSLSLKEAMQH